MSRQKRSWQIIMVYTIIITIEILRALTIKLTQARSRSRVRARAKGLGLWLGIGL